MTISDFLGRNLQPIQALNQEGNSKHKQKKFEFSALPQEHTFRFRKKLKKKTCD
jgi:hypothetical protein